MGGGLCTFELPVSVLGMMRAILCNFDISEQRPEGWCIISEKSACLPLTFSTKQMGVCVCVNSGGHNGSPRPPLALELRMFPQTGTNYLVQTVNSVLMCAILRKPP